MTHMEIKALEQNAPRAAAWTQAYDGQSHYAQIMLALMPATLILFAATALLLALL